MADVYGKRMNGGEVKEMFLCGAGLISMTNLFLWDCDNPKTGSGPLVPRLLRYEQQLILKKFYHDPTRYLSSQFLGAINAQKGSFNVS